MGLDTLKPWCDQISSDFVKLLWCSPRLDEFLVHKPSQFTFLSGKPRILLLTFRWCVFFSPTNKKPQVPGFFLAHGLSTVRHLWHCGLRLDLENGCHQQWFFLDFTSAKGCLYSFGLNVCKVHVQMGATEELGWTSCYDLRWDLTCSGNEIKVKSSIFQIHLPFSELFKYEGLKVGGLGCGNFGQAPVIMFMEGTPRRFPDYDDLQRMDVKHIRLYPLLCWDVWVILLQFA